MINTVFATSQMFSDTPIKQMILQRVCFTLQYIIVSCILPPILTCWLCHRMRSSVRYSHVWNTVVSDDGKIVLGALCRLRSWYKLCGVYCYLFAYWLLYALVVHEAEREGYCVIMWSIGWLHAVTHNISYLRHYELNVDPQIYLCNDHSQYWKRRHWRFYSHVDDKEWMPEQKM